MKSVKVEISTRAKDNKLHKPQILLELTYNHILLNDFRNIIAKPHTFLNEANLTAVALSIRLAMLDEKLKNSGGCKILVLDDLLISLDMSNRDVVLDILLEKDSEFQLIILTHDRAFFNIAKLRIQNADNGSNEWAFKELYHKEDEELGIPMPIFLNPQAYLSCAHKYFKEFDYPACANYLRKECERVISHLLPHNEIIYISEAEGSKPLPLEQLIKNFEKMCKRITLDYSPYKKLIEYKNILLNPLSHDNIKSPIYRQELKSILKILKEINKLEKVIISSADNANGYLEIKIKDSTNDDWQYRLHVKEHFFVIKDTKNGLYFLSNPLTFFEKRQKEDFEEPLNSEKSLQNGYKNICHALKISDAAPKLEDVLFFSNGKSVSEFLK